jgi:thiamine biosynthesis lipoprotein
MKTVHDSGFPVPGSCSRSVLGSVFGVLCSIVLVACSGVGTSDSTTDHLIVERSRLSMGSEVRITASVSRESDALRAFEKVFDEFDRLDRLLSVWHADSDVSRINAAAGVEPVKVTAETLELLRTAKQVGEWTGGKFDVTFGALSGLWKFDHDQDNQIPRTVDVHARLPDVDFRSIELNVERGTVFLPRPRMRLHLGGIGKGHAVDRSAAILRADGVTDFLIQAGGDLYAGGARSDRPWRASIRDPRGPADRSVAAMNVRDETFSTSGDYERYFIRDGRRYHHILDPDTGEPARGCRSVTIVARHATLADALSTGVFVLGPQAGMALIEKLPDVEGVIVTDSNMVMVSSGLTERLERLHPPTDAP